MIDFSLEDAAAEPPSLSETSEFGHSRCNAKGACFDTRTMDSGLCSCLCQATADRTVADPSQADPDGWTPLLYAASTGNAEVIEYFLELGLDSDTRNKKGESAFNLSTLRGFQTTIDLLKRSGADTCAPLFPVVEGIYMGQEPPGQTPEIFFPIIVSGHHRAHSSITFSLDALDAYWTEMIPPEGQTVHMKAEDNRWSYPQHTEIGRDPTFSPDGSRLFFIKTRPLREGELPGGDPSLKEEYWYLVYGEIQYWLVRANFSR